jgi:hypothetical protein
MRTFSKKSASVVRWGGELNHLREKGGVLTLKTPRGVCAYPYETVSRPEFAQDHESGLRYDRGPVVLCDFSKLRFRKSPYDF